MFSNTKSLRKHEIRDIKQSKYPIIYVPAEVLVEKLRKSLDCEDLRAVEIDEAYRTRASI